MSDPHQRSGRRSGNGFPVHDVDLYSDEVIASPYKHYQALRNLGPAVWLPKNGLWAISRHADVRECLSRHEVFISGKGVAANEPTNRISAGNLLASDPPEHDLLREIVAAPLHLKALRDLKPRIEAAAEGLIERLVARGSFDAVTDLAEFLPVTIVSDLVGLPEEGRQNMLRWAAATFDMLGADNERARQARPVTEEMRAYTLNDATRDRLKPDGWAARLYSAADEGLIPYEKCPVLMRDYLGPSLDTTIFATGHLMLLLARNPDQWEILRTEPALIPNAINEAVRLASPVRGFTRYVARDYVLEDLTIPAGDRVLILFASANRDERRWDEPETYDIRRVLTDHVGFGHGIHACAGMQLARLEMRAILSAMITRVRRFEVGEPVQAMNNVLFGLESLPMRVIAS